ncbi:MAG: hypothetical protein ACKO6A_00365 [Bacteroidota bacterium]
MDSTNTKIKNAGKLMMRSFKIKLACIILIIIELELIRAGMVHGGKYWQDNEPFILTISVVNLSLLMYSFLVEYEIAKIFQSVEE